MIIVVQVKYIFIFIPIIDSKLKDMETISFAPKDDVDLYLTVNIIKHSLTPFKKNPINFKTN